MNSNEIAKTVYYFRKQSKLSRLELSKLAGVGKTVVYDLEKGKVTIQLDSLLKILDVLNIHLNLETPFTMPTENER